MCCVLQARRNAGGSAVCGGTAANCERDLGERLLDKQILLAASASSLFGVSDNGHTTSLLDYGFRSKFARAVGLSRLLAHRERAGRKFDQRLYDRHPSVCRISGES